MTKPKRAAKPPGLMPRLRLHLKTDPAKLPVLEQTFQMYERPNLHMAIEQLAAEGVETAALIGLVLHHEHDTARLAKLSRPVTARYFEEGPVEYTDVPLAG